MNGIRPWLSFYEPGRNRLLALSAAGFAAVLLLLAGVLGPAILRDVGEHHAWARAVAVGRDASEAMARDADRLDMVLLNTDIGVFDWMGDWEGVGENIPAAQRAVADRLAVVERFRDAANRRRRDALAKIRAMKLRPAVAQRYLAEIDQNLYRQARAYNRMIEEEAAILTAKQGLLALMARRKGHWRIEDGSPAFDNPSDWAAGRAFALQIYEAQRRLAGWSQSLRTSRVFSLSPP